MTTLSHAAPAHSGRLILNVIRFVLLALAIAAMIGLERYAAAGDLSGTWRGDWQSCVTGHKGPLNAKFVRCDDSQYEVTFSGRFFKLLPFRFRVTLDVVREEGDTVELSGSSYLGRMFGTFYYTATANGCNFTSNYTSCKDNGVFRLTRCTDTSCCCE